MRLSLIVAAAENNVIGVAGDLPWRLSDDLRRFKRLTMGHAMVMGRRTWESIGRALPGRVSIVVSRRDSWHPKGALLARSLDAALALAQTTAAEQDHLFVIGGAELYRTALPTAQRLYFTRVHATVDGDVTFPDVDWRAWELVEQCWHEANARNDHAFTSQIWQRRQE
jgi:dihydrofolate reductase